MSTGRLADLPVITHQPGVWKHCVANNSDIVRYVSALKIDIRSIE